MWPLVSPKSRFPKTTILTWESSKIQGSIVTLPHHSAGYKLGKGNSCQSLFLFLFVFVFLNFSMHEFVN